MFTENSIYGIIERVAAKVPQNHAYWFQDRFETYGRLLDRIHIFAKAMIASGIGQHDAVMVILPNCPQVIISMYAANMIGAVICLVHPASSQNDLQDYAEQAKPKIVITTPDRVEMVRTAVGENAIVVATDPMDEIRVAASLQKLQFRRFLYNDRMTSKLNSWNAMMQQYSGVANDKSYGNPEDVAMIVFSGGTTGRQKAVLLSNHNLVALSEVLQKALPVPNENDGFLVLMPNFHLLGIACVLFPVSYGITAVILPQFSAKTFRDAIVASGCTFLVGSPSVYISMMNLSNWQKDDLKGLKMAASAGESLKESTRSSINAFISQHGGSVPVQDAYGMTEVCLIAMEDQNTAQRSVKLTYGTEVLIVDPATRERLVTDTPGEVLVCNPLLQTKYLNEEDNLAAIESINGKTYFKTGDMGYLDNAGNLHINGRIKRMIISGGYNIYPDTIENVINEIPEVRECCVIGVDSENGTQAVKAVMALHQNNQSDRAAYEAQVKNKIISHCRNTLTQYEMPTVFEFVDQLPKTLAGKVAFTKL